MKNLLDFINVGAEIGIPVVNQLIKNGFKIPNSFMNTVVIQSASFTSNQDYLSVTFSP